MEGSTSALEELEEVGSNLGCSLNHAVLLTRIKVRYPVRPKGVMTTGCDTDSKDKCLDQYS